MLCVKRPHYRPCRTTWRPPLQVYIVHASVFVTDGGLTDPAKCICFSCKEYNETDHPNYVGAIRAMATSIRPSERIGTIMGGKA